MLFLLTNYTSESTLSISIPEEAPIISDDVRRWLDTLLNIPIFAFSLLGIVTNSVNVRVFIKQGLTSDSSTIGLSALAVADFLGCLTLIPYTICDFLKYTALRPVVGSCTSFTSVTCTIPHAMMSRITCWITVYIAIERCVCVLIPFKVRALLKPRVTIAAMAIIYVIFLVLYMPVFFNFGIKMQHDRTLNVTVIIIVENAMAKIIAKYWSLVTNTVMSTIALIINAMATGLMLYKLNKFTKWRRKTASTGQGPESQDDTETVNNVRLPHSGQRKRDIEVLKTVLMVTALFLACLSMSHFPGFAAAFLPGFSFTGINSNAFVVLYRYKYLFDVVNSSLNYFFYIRTSSRFKAAHKEIFTKKM